MILGLICVVLAAVLSGTGSVLEAVGTRKASAAAGDGAVGDTPPPTREVAKQPLYWIGITIDLLGFVAAAAAMQYLPLFLVQAGVASSVGITALLSRFWLGTRMSTWSRSSLIIMFGGLIALAVSAQPGQVPPLSWVWTWIPLFWALPTAAIAVLAYRATSAKVTSALLALAAGSGYSAVAVAARSLDIPREGWSALADPNLFAVIVNGLLATIFFAGALQRGNVTTVSSINYVTETVLPSVVGLAFFHESVRSGLAGVAIAGFILAVDGAVAVAGLHRPTSPSPRTTTPLLQPHRSGPLQLLAHRRWYRHRPDGESPVAETG